VVRLRHGDGTLLVAAENQGATRAYEVPVSGGRWHQLSADASRLLLTHEDGHQSVKECYYGSGFLSQNGRSLWLPESVVSVEEISFQQSPL